MYKSSEHEYVQLCFTGFNATCGMQLDPENEWVKKSSVLPWHAWESLYAAMFDSTTGNVAKPCRMVLGSIIIQTRMGYTDRELVEQIQQNPYYQYFIGLDSFRHEAPFTAPLLVEWRKRMDVSFITNVNDVLCNAMPVMQEKKTGKNYGTLLATQICDATVAPQYIRFPQDTSLLNEARVKLEGMIDFFCAEYGFDKPRTYRKKAHKEYLSFAKSKKPSAEKIREVVKKLLGYVRRDIGYIDSYMQQGYAPRAKQIGNIITIFALYEQQKYMYDNRTHKVENRIVSISQPYVRPIVRGKAKQRTEFGAKLHLSIDGRGFGRIEHISFDAFNEGPQLIDALRSYQYRNGAFPERVLVDQLYRTKRNLDFCAQNNIRISGPKRGRPVTDAVQLRTERRIADKDNKDRIEIERFFSVAKRRNGMGMIKRKRQDTSLSTICMSVLVTNIFGSFQQAIEEYEELQEKQAKRRKKRAS